MAETMVTAGEVAASLAARLRGDVIDPGHPEYEEVRKVQNGTIDRRPRLIARCADAADVMACVSFAREHGLEIAIRGGAHSAPGFGVVDDGLVIDMSRIHNVRVDPGARLATVGAGATLADLDHATHAFGLAVPAGVVSTTGVGGLTLGGGSGHLTRKYGLTIDNLVEADVVLADGSFVKASEDENDDLFWALRGGGGNFGVVTSFTFRLHPVRNVIAGPMLWPIERAPEIMRFYADFLPRATEDLNGVCALLVVPPGPPFPEELHGKTMCAIIWCHVGSPAEAQAALAPARELTPALDGVMELPFPALQAAFDEGDPPGFQDYWRGDFLAELPDTAIERYVESMSNLPTPLCQIHLYPVDGAAARVPRDATAWSYRDAQWSMVIIGVGADPADAGPIKRWAVEAWEAVHPHALEGGYVNFIADEGQERVQASYRDNYDRLARIKAKYDPDNVFHLNQNIKPVG